MKFVWKMFIGLTVAIVTVLLYCSYKKIYDSWTGVGLLFYAIIFSIGLIYIIIDAYIRGNMKNNEEETKTDLHYCWEQMNMKIKLMPGDKSLTWDDGFSRQSVLKAYNNGDRQIFFRSFIARTTRQQLAVVIYNCENKNITVYNADPDLQTLEDPFKNFNPFNTITNNYPRMNDLRNNNPFRNVDLNLNANSSSDFNTANYSPNNNNSKVNSIPDPNKYANGVINKIQNYGR